MKARIAVVAAAPIWLGSAAVSQQLPGCADSHHRFHKSAGDFSKTFMAAFIEEAGTLHLGTPIA